MKIDKKTSGLKKRHLRALKVNRISLGNRREIIEKASSTEMLEYLRQSDYKAYEKQHGCPPISQEESYCYLHYKT